MASEELPWELVEEILSWVPRISLARFRTVCKRCNALFEDKRFANSHLTRASRPQFILFTESNIFSVDVILNDCLRKLPLDIPGYRLSMLLKVDCCDGLLLCFTWNHGIAVCNPWLKQTRWTKLNDISSCFNNIVYQRPHFRGIGYDSSRSGSHYKIFTCQHAQYVDSIVKVWITEFGSNTWKFHKFVCHWRLLSEHSVSLNGTLYWVARYFGNYESHDHDYFIQSFDFSMEKFEPFCILPDNSNSLYDLRSLEVFRRDRFSYLHQCSKTKSIDIWVTAKKIENEDGEAVEWIKFMNVSVPGSSCLKNMYNDKISYFIDDKSLIVCCSDHNGQAYIYIAKGDKIKEIKIEDVVEFRPWHLTYFPSLVQVPSYQEKEKKYKSFNIMLLFRIAKWSPVSGLLILIIFLSNLLSALFPFISNNVFPI